jgi:hypothetical protein
MQPKVTKVAAASRRGGRGKWHTADHRALVEITRYLASLEVRI